MSEIIKILNNKDYTIDNVARLISENDSKLRNTLQTKLQKIIFEAGINFRNSEKIIKISNYCSANCSFCESRIDNNKLNRFRLNREEIIEKAVTAYKMGYESIVIHSGYDDFYNTDRIAYILYSIKKKAKLKITLSLGLRKKNEYKKWKIAGADAYFLTFVTKSIELYKQSNSLGTLAKRVEHINELKSIGYSVGTGSILGLQNETVNTIAEDIVFAKNIDANFIGFCKYSNNSVENILGDELANRSVEVAQIVVPKVNVGLYNF